MYYNLELFSIATCCNAVSFHTLVDLLDLELRQQCVSILYPTAHADSITHLLLHRTCYLRSVQDLDGRSSMFGCCSGGGEDGSN
jgi:hypothetical protein